MGAFEGGFNLFPASHGLRPGVPPEDRDKESSAEIDHIALAMNAQLADAARQREEILLNRLGNQAGLTNQAHGGSALNQSLSDALSAAASTGTVSNTQAPDVTYESILENVNRLYREMDAVSSRPVTTGGTPPQSLTTGGSPTRTITNTGIGGIQVIPNQFLPDGSVYYINGDIVTGNVGGFLGGLAGPATTRTYAPAYTYAPGLFGPNGWEERERRAQVFGVGPAAKPPEKTPETASPNGKRSILLDKEI